MMMEAFPLAEKYRNPVMILGDGLIGQMMEPVEFPDQLKSEPSNKDDWATSGMDTRGSATRNLVKTLYLVPEELNAHNLKLKAKYDRMKREEIRFEPYNLDGDYRVLIVSYGTMSRVCRTVIDNFKAKGIEVGMVRPQTLFPFPKQAICEAAAKAELPGRDQRRDEHGPDGRGRGAQRQGPQAGALVRQVRRRGAHPGRSHGGSLRTLMAS